MADNEEELISFSSSEEYCVDYTSESDSEMLYLQQVLTEYYIIVKKKITKNIWNCIKHFTIQYPYTTIIVLSYYYLIHIKICDFHINQFITYTK